MELENISFDARYSPDTECRWNSYSDYRLILWAWMLNEFSVVFAAAEMTHNGYYIHSIIHFFAAILIGIPLVYSEICLAQYTNCDVLSMWNFFPLFRPVGYGAIYLVILRMTFVLTFASWYLQYTFYAALDPPPWFSCEDFNLSRCMLKRINVSVFQHCLEAQLLFNDDCGIKTASSLFFEREIGNNIITKSIYCPVVWKGIVASSSICTVIFVLSLKKVKFLQILAKLLAFYVSIVILVLLSVALSTSGAWYATKITVDWSKYHFSNCFKTIIRGFNSLGTGYGIISYISKDIPFRSPATMTSICVPLFAIFLTIMYGLIGFSGVKTMSYYHGEEENVIEVGVGSYFNEFASISEILSYFDETSVWGFTWFSSIFLCLFVVYWILYSYLRDLIFEKLTFTQRHKTLTEVMITIVMCLMSWPLFCSDITGMFEDAIELIQIINSFLFSISLYWIYGYKKHSVDIIFMIGIKPSYFWKIAWVLNPILIFGLGYGKWMTLNGQDLEDPLFIESIGTYYDLLMVYVLVGIYNFIVCTGILYELYSYYRHGMIRDILFSADDWGPRDIILFKSRKMFVPEIMTREFLYRQVRIYGYAKQPKTARYIKKSTKRENTESVSIEGEWTAMTSN